MNDSIIQTPQQAVENVEPRLEPVQQNTTMQAPNNNRGLKVVVVGLVVFIILIFVLAIAAAGLYLFLDKDNSEEKNETEQENVEQEEETEIINEDRDPLVEENNNEVPMEGSITLGDTSFILPEGWFESSRFNTNNSQLDSCNNTRLGGEVEDCEVVSVVHLDSGTSVKFSTPGWYVIPDGYKPQVSVNESINFAGSMMNVTLLYEPDPATITDPGDVSGAEASDVPSFYGFCNTDNFCTSIDFDNPIVTASVSERDRVVRELWSDLIIR